MYTFNEYYGKVIEPSISKKLNDFKDWAEFNNHLNWLILLAKKQFITEGLPATMDEETIENNFLFRGMVCAQDIYGKPFSLGANPYNTLTVFGKPANGRAIAINGDSYESTYYWEYMDNLEQSNSVIGFDNDNAYPFINYIVDRAYKLADCMRSIDTAVTLSKVGGIIKVPEAQKNAIVNIINNVNSNVPYIIITTKKGGVPIDIDYMGMNFNTAVIKELWDNYNNLKAETLAMFGINCNSNSDKKERMTVAEVKGDASLPIITENARLEQRKKFYDRVNKKFGTNITIKSRYNSIEDAENITENMEENNEEQGDNNYDTEA